MIFNQTVSSNSKINLGLQVPFRYPNGFHHIVSLFVPIDLNDEMNISVEISENNDFSMTWENNLPPIFNIERTARVFENDYQENLIFKTDQWIKNILSTENISFPNLKTKVHILKRIPSPAGLGGGSSNAASLIKFYIDFLKKEFGHLNLTLVLKKIESKCILLGSDIPFFLKNRYSLISGTGEIYKDYPHFNFCGIMGIPGFGFSTPEMYRSLQRPQISMEINEFFGLLNKESKNTLQPDNSILFNLKNLHNEFDRFCEGIKNNDLESLLCENKDGQKGKLLYREGHRTFFVNNNFIEVARNLFPEKYLILETIKKLSIEKMMVLAKDFENPYLLTSMSGSGATMFAGFVLPEFPDKVLQERFEDQVKALRLEFPDIYWVKFCSLK